MNECPVNTLPRPEQLIWTVEQTAGVLNVTPDTVRGLHRVGRLRGVLVSSRCLRWRPEDVQRFVQSLSGDGET